MFRVTHSNFQANKVLRIVYPRTCPRSLIKPTSVYHGKQNLTLTYSFLDGFIEGEPGSIAATSMKTRSFEKC